MSREGCGNEEEEGGQWCRGKDSGEEGKGGSGDEKKEYSGDEGKENRGRRTVMMMASRTVVRRGRRRTYGKEISG